MIKLFIAVLAVLLLIGDILMAPPLYAAETAVSLYATANLNYEPVHATSSQSAVLAVSSDNPLIIAIGRTLNDGGAEKPNFACEQGGARYTLLGYSDGGEYQTISASYLAPAMSGTTTVTCWTTNHTGLSGQITLISLANTAQVVSDFATTTFTSASTGYITNSIAPESGDFLLSAIQTALPNYNHIESSGDQRMITGGNDCDYSSGACALGYKIAADLLPYRFVWQRPSGFSRQTNAILLRVSAAEITKNISANETYQFSGWLSPVKPDGVPTYKFKRTLPIKFQLKNTQGEYVSTARINLLASKIENGLVDSKETILSMPSTSGFSAFKYDDSSNQYIFNLETAVLSPGIWRLKIELDDGKTYTAVISLTD